MFEILSLVCLIEYKDDIMKENLADLFGKDNRLFAPGKGFIMELGWGCLILLVLIVSSIIAVNRIFGQDSVSGLSA